MKISLPLSVLVLLPGVALAGGFDIAPYVGSASGTLWIDTGVICFRSPCPSYLESKDDTVVGVVADYGLTSRLDLEVLAGHQESELRYRLALPSEIGVVLPTVGFDITHFEVGLRRRWDLGRTEPFGAFGVGITHLASDDLVGNRIDTDRFSASLAAGARVALGERLGLRLELRGRRINLGDHLTGGPGFPVRVLDGDLDQLQGLVGFSFRTRRAA